MSNRRSTSMYETVLCEYRKVSGHLLVNNNRLRDIPFVHPHFRKSNHNVQATRRLAVMIPKGIRGGEFGRYETKQLFSKRDPVG